MEVDVWSGKWDLPSVDQQCLQIMVKESRGHPHTVYYQQFLTI